LRELLGNFQPARISEGGKHVGTALEVAVSLGHATTLGLSMNIERLCLVNFR
jgi:hypothetical protein